jgi:hypothetical protein
VFAQIAALLQGWRAHQLLGANHRFVFGYAKDDFEQQAPTVLRQLNLAEV